MRPAECPWKTIADVQSLAFRGNRHLIPLAGMEHQVYLAVSEEAYRNILQRDGLREVVALSRMAILVVNVTKEEVVLGFQPPSVRSNTELAIA
ncbi:MAG TPA: element excision factor XisH family protein [Armatimonadota bacterium]|nr:element excision factor XisH family protein [Armatimonadota bacterium]